MLSLSSLTFDFVVVVDKVFVCFYLGIDSLNILLIFIGHSRPLSVEELEDQLDIEHADLALAQERKSSCVQNAHC